MYNVSSYTFGTLFLKVSVASRHHVKGLAILLYNTNYAYIIGRGCCTSKVSSQLISSLTLSHQTRGPPSSSQHPGGISPLLTAFRRCAPPHILPAPFLNSCSPPHYTCCLVCLLIPAPHYTCCPVCLLIPAPHYTCCPVCLLFATPHYTCCPVCLLIPPHTIPAALCVS